jgi:hypothetical protein
MNEAELAEKLKRIQALFAGAATEGERAAALAAKERVESRLESLRAEAPEEFSFSLTNPWSRRLLVALLRRHGIEPFRRPGQRRTTVRARGTERRINQIWREFRRLDETLVEYLEEVASRVIRDVVHTDQTDAAVVETPAQSA